MNKIVREGSCDKECGYYITYVMHAIETMEKMIPPSSQAFTDSLKIIKAVTYTVRRLMRLFTG